jgi:hypothetical protein
MSVVKYLYGNRSYKGAVFVRILLHVYPLLGNVLKQIPTKTVNSSLLGYATIDEAVFSMSMRSSGGTMGLCNPFLSDGSVNMFPHIRPCYESGDIIRNRDGVFHVVCAERREWQNSFRAVTGQS